MARVQVVRRKIRHARCRRSRRPMARRSDGSRPPPKGRWRGGAAGAWGCRGATERGRGGVWAWGRACSGRFATTPLSTNRVCCAAKAMESGRHGAGLRDMPRFAGGGVRTRRADGGVPCTTVVQMPKHNPSSSLSRPAQVGTRLSVTVPADHYRQMQDLAARKRVSIAWVVRDAVDQYLAAHGDPGARSGSSRKPQRLAPGKGAA